MPPTIKNLPSGDCRTLFEETGISKSCRRVILCLNAESLLARLRRARSPSHSGTEVVEDSAYILPDFRSWISILTTSRLYYSQQELAVVIDVYSYYSCRFVVLSMTSIDALQEIASDAFLRFCFCSIFADEWLWSDRRFFFSHGQRAEEMGAARRRVPGSGVMKRKVQMMKLVS